MVDVTMMWVASTSPKKRIIMELCPKKVDVMMMAFTFSGNKELGESIYFSADWNPP
jgi:hypothetical protein